MSAATKRKSASPYVDQQEAQRRVASECACFAVGEIVDVLGGSGEFLNQATITHEYGCYEVVEDEGVYATSDGLFFNYKYGYLVRPIGDDRSYFVPPHRVASSDGKPSYLRLATDRGRAVEMQRNRGAAVILGLCVDALREPDEPEGSEQ